MFCRPGEREQQPNQFSGNAKRGKKSKRHTGVIYVKQECTEVIISQNVREIRRTHYFFSWTDPARPRGHAGRRINNKNKSADPSIQLALKKKPQKGFRGKTRGSDHYLLLLRDINCVQLAYSPNGLACLSPSMFGTFRGPRPTTMTTIYNPV